MTILEVGYLVLALVQTDGILHEQERLVRQELRTQSSGEVEPVEEHSASTWGQAWCSREIGLHPAGGRGAWVIPSSQ